MEWLTWLLCTWQVRNDLQMGRLPPVQPFHAMAYPFSADLALAISQKYAQYCALTASRMRAPQLSHPPARPLAPGERLRIAYVSSDFGNHPLSHLMGSIFGLHDRSKVRGAILVFAERFSHPVLQQSPRTYVSFLPVDVQNDLSVPSRYLGFCCTSKME